MFRTEVCAGFDPKQVARTLGQHGALRLASDGGFTRMERLPNKERARMYVVLPELWAEDGDDGEADA